MIDQLGLTIEQLLRTELNIRNDEIEISFSQPNAEWSGRRSSQPAINLFLYDVRENPTLRRHQWQQLHEPGNGVPRRDPAQIKRAPLMLDCFYLVTAWSGADERARALEEHQLLSRALRALARYAVLNPRFEERERAEAFAGASYDDANAHESVTVELAGGGHGVGEEWAGRRAWLNNPDLNLLRDVDVEVRTRIAHHDVMTNPAEVWSALESQMKAGFSYVVTLPLDPWSAVEADRVSQARFDYRIDDAAPSVDEPLYAIGGVIYDETGAPQPDLKLRLLHGTPGPKPKSSAFVDGHSHELARTNSNGAYRFHGLIAGQYTLLIQRTTNNIVQRDLTVSGTGPTGYDFTV